MSKITLRRIGPQYEHDAHYVYYNLLRKALDDPRILNIALSGPFASGKSSILEKLKATYPSEMIHISLANFKFATDRDDGEESEKHSRTKQEQVQREVVKQILYSEKPGKRRSSRFKRIQNFNYFENIYLSLIIGLLLAVIVIFNDWHLRFLEKLSFVTTGSDWTAYLLMATIPILVFTISFLLRGRFAISGLSAGPAKVSISSTPESYFDKYLDEITHFFSSKGRTVVIFEDLDRSNSHEIFQDLYSLGLILNLQLDRSRSNRVQFIYAIKDSIFFENPKSAEGATERTKFFDVIIPIIPFLGHHNASKFLNEEIGSSSPVVKRVVKVAAPYITDMRLIKNIATEFEIFREVISRTARSEINSEADSPSLIGNENILAMVIYKNLYADDFELIPIGTSNLDKIVQSFHFAKRVLVMNQRLQARRTEQMIANQNIRAESLAVSLFQAVNQEARRKGNNTKGKIIGAGNAKIEVDNPQFWHHVVKGDIDQLYWSPGPKRQALSLTTLSQRGLMNLVNANEDGAVFKDSPSHLQNQLAEYEDRHSNLKLVEISKLLATGDEIKFSAIDENDDGNSKTFYQKVSEVANNNQLLIRFLQEGFIDKYFPFYTSIFQSDGLTFAGMSFMKHNVETGVPDYYSSIHERDIKIILEMYDHTEYSIRGYLNNDLLDYILRSPNQYIEFINGLVQFILEHKADGEGFIENYLSDGQRPHALIQVLTGRVPWFLEFLIMSISRIKTKDQLDFLRHALKHLPSEKIQIGPEATDYIKNNETIFNKQLGRLTAEQAKRIVGFINMNSILIKDVSHLSEPLLEEVRKAAVFLPTQENLQKLFASTDIDVSLDFLYAQNKRVFDHVMDNFLEYIDSVTDGPTITSTASAGDLSGIFHALESVHTVRTDDIILRTIESMERNSNIHLQDISVFNQEHLDHLIGEGVAPLSWENLRFYTENFTRLNEHTDTLIPALQIEFRKMSKNKSRFWASLEEGIDSEKEALAIFILSHLDRFIDADSAIDLIDLMSLKYYLDISEISIPEGKLFPSLIERQILAPDISTYRKTESLTWSIREEVLNAMAKIDKPEYKVFIDLSADDLTEDFIPFFESDYIDVNGKIKVAERSKDFVKIFEESTRASEVYIWFIAQHEIEVSQRALGALMRNVHRNSQLDLIASQLQFLTEEQVINQIQFIGEPFSLLVRKDWSRPKGYASEGGIAIIKWLQEKGYVGKVVWSGNKFHAWLKRS